MSEMVRVVSRLAQEQETVTREQSRKNENAWRATVSIFLALSGLRTLHIASGFDSSGDMTDFGNLDHHLTLNGDPDYSFDGLIPYVDLDGTGDYFSTVDHADFDILGTESYVVTAAQGLTLYWIGQVRNAPAVGNGYGVVSKDDAPANRSYGIVVLNAQTVRFHVSGDGAAILTQASTGIFTLNTWFIAVGRYRTSVPDISIFFNTDAPDTNAAGIPAAIFNGNAPYEIGRYDLGNELLGYSSLTALYAEAHDDALITSTIQQVRAMLGI